MKVRPAFFLISTVLIAVIVGISVYFTPIWEAFIIVGPPRYDRYTGCPADEASHPPKLFQ